MDADLFQVVQNCGPVAAAWQWSDAAPAPAIGDLFDAIIGVCSEGMYLEMVYPEEGNLSYWDMSWDVTSPMAAIAYAGAAPMIMCITPRNTRIALRTSTT